MKKELRQSIRQLKSNYSVLELKQMSVPIIEALKRHPKFVVAKKILLYHSLPDEVCTHFLIQECAKTKQILLPVVKNDDLVLKKYKDEKSLSEGAFSILEPIGEEESFDSIDLIVVPGMAFDLQGNRLGRGKGYYDRLLSKFSNVFTIGICFPFQMLKSIPTESFDRPVDFVIS